MDVKGQVLVTEASQLPPGTDDPVGLLFTGKILQQILSFKILVGRVSLLLPVVDTSMPSSVEETEDALPPLPPPLSPTLIHTLLSEDPGAGGHRGCPPFHVPGLKRARFHGLATVSSV